MKKTTKIFFAVFTAIPGLLMAQYSCPTITISGSPQLCRGMTTIITVTGGTSYHWSTGATTSSIYVTPPASITYTVEVGNGACFKDTTVTIIVDTMPRVVFKGDTSICKNTKTNVSVVWENNYTYLWSTSSTSDSISIKDTIPGFYNYYITVANGACSVDSAKITVHVNNCIQGVTDYSDPIGIETFPNPASSWLSVILDNPVNQNGVLSITDVTGRQVYSEVVSPTQSRFTIDVSHLASAIYFLRIQTDKGIILKKFVKD